MPFRLYSPVPAPLCRSAALLALALGLGGCANFAGIGPNARMTEPQALGLGSAAPKAAPAPALASPAWWARFGDAQLDALAAKPP